MARSPVTTAQNNHQIDYRSIKSIYWLPILILILTCIIALQSYQSRINQNIAIINAQLNHEINTIHQEIQRSLVLYEYGLLSLKAAIDSEPFEQFNVHKMRNYAKSFNFAERFPGTRGFGFIDSVEQSAINDYVQRIRAERQDQFTIKQLNEHNDSNFVIRIIEPQIFNEQAVGLDIGSEITRRRGALASARLNRTQLTGPITLVQASAQVKHGFLLLHPKFTEKGLAGWVYSPLLIDEILLSISHLHPAMQLSISDTSANGQKVTFYQSIVDNENLANVNADKKLEIYGREWLINLQPTDFYIKNLNLPNPISLIYIVFFIGIVLSVISAFILTYVKRRSEFNRQNFELAAILENSSDAIVGLDSNFCIRTWNTAASNLLNLDEQALSSKISEWLTPYLDSDTIVKILKKVQFGGTIKDIEIELLFAEKNEDFHAKLNFAPILDVNKKFNGCTLAIIDISEQKNNQAKLEDSYKHLKHTLKHQSDIELHLTSLVNLVIDKHEIPLISTNKEGIITFLNPAAEILFHIEARSALGEVSIFSLLPQFTHTEQLDELTDSQPIDCLTHNNRAFTSNLTISYLHNGEYNIGYLFEFFSDFYSEKNNTTDDFHYQLCTFSEKTSQDILLWADEDGFIFKANPFAKSKLNYSQSELAKINLTALFSNFVMNWQELKNKLKEDERYSFEANIETQFKFIIPCMVSSHLIKLDNKICYFISARDITDRKEKEVALLDAKAISDRANQSKSDFIAKLSRKLRNPIQELSGTLDLIRIIKDVDLRQIHLNNTKQSIKYLTHIIDDLFDITQIEANELKLKKSLFSFELFLNELADIISVASSHKELEVYFYSKVNIENYLIGDHGLLFKAITNLTYNAIQYSDKGNICLSFTPQNISTSRIAIEFSITDEGVGMSESKIHDILHTFIQLDGQSSREYSQHGLGISIAKEIITMMGGELTITSAIQKGTQVNFVLEFDLGPDVDDTKLTNPTSTPLNVLIIDDNNISLNVLANFAEQFGWQYSAVNHPDLGLEAIKNAHLNNQYFDLILVDWKMPGINGWQFSETVRQDMHLKSSPLIIMVTAHTKPMLAERTSSGKSVINGFLTKPITKKQLLDVVIDSVGQQLQYPLIEKNTSTQLIDIRILVVDDNPTTLTITEELLKNHSATVSVAYSGAQALTILNDSILTFDLVLMDLVMPTMDGFETSRRIHEIPRYQHLPIIALTASVLPEDIQMCKEEGMVAHIGKPFSTEQLINPILSTVKGRTVDANEFNLAVPPALLLNSDIKQFVTTHSIQIEPALARTGNSEKTYLKLLQLFLTDLLELQGIYQHQTKLPDASDGLKAHLHTIKGSAATIGFNKLAKFAADSEVTLSQSNQQLKELCLVQLIEQLNEYPAIVGHLIELVNHHLHEDNVVDLTHSEQLAIARQLKEQLSHAEMQSLESYQKIATYLKRANKESTEIFEIQINALNFKYCSTLIDHLIEALQHHG